MKEAEKEVAPHNQPLPSSPLFTLICPAGHDPKLILYFDELKGKPY